MEFEAGDYQGLGAVRVLTKKNGAKNGCVVFASLQQPQGATSPTDSSVPISAAHLEEKKTKVYAAIKEENLIRTIMFRVGSASIANVLMGGRGIANSVFFRGGVCRGISNISPTTQQKYRYEFGLVAVSPLRELVRIS